MEDDVENPAVQRKLFEHYFGNFGSWTNKPAGSSASLNAPARIRKRYAVWENGMEVHQRQRLNESCDHKVVPICPSSNSFLGAAESPYEYRAVLLVQDVVVLRSDGSYSRGRFSPDGPELDRCKGKNGWGNNLIFMAKPNRQKADSGFDAIGAGPGAAKCEISVARLQSLAACLFRKTRYDRVRRRWPRFCVHG